MLYAVIRIRGSTGVNRDVLYTLKLMRMNRINHMVLVPDTKATKGMLQKVKDYVTWGEINQETLEMVLRARLRAEGNRPVDEKTLADLTEGKYKTYTDLARALLASEVAMNDIKGLKPLFRLSPPKKGHGGIKRAFKVGGALGYRKDEINELIKRMV